jgi:hypothetical protein
VGPALISGDCTTAGHFLSVPWLLLICIAGVLSIIWDLYQRSSEMNFYDLSMKDWATLVFLVTLSGMMVVPIWLLKNKLKETRIWASPALRQVLASRAFSSDVTSAHTGVMIEIIGKDWDKVARTLMQFTNMIGHGQDFVTASPDEQPTKEAFQVRLSTDSRSNRSVWCYSSGCVCRCGKCNGECSPNTSCPCGGACKVQPLKMSVHEDVIHDLSYLAAMQVHRKPSLQVTSADLRIRVHIMSTFAHRDALFGSDEAMKKLDAQRKRTVFVWTGTGEKPLKDKDGNLVPADPFNRYKGTQLPVDGQVDSVGQVMMNYLVIIAHWEKHNLAHTVFSSVSAKLVEVLHDL